MTLEQISTYTQLRRQVIRTEQELNQLRNYIDRAFPDSPIFVDESNSQLQYKILTPHSSIGKYTIPQRDFIPSKLWGREVNSNIIQWELNQNG